MLCYTLGWTATIRPWQCCKAATVFVGVQVLRSRTKTILIWERTQLLIKGKYTIILLKSERKIQEILLLYVRVLDFSYFLSEKSDCYHLRPIYFFNILSSEWLFAHEGHAGIQITSRQSHTNIHSTAIADETATIYVMSHTISWTDQSINQRSTFRLIGSNKRYVD